MEDNKEIGLAKESTKKTKIVSDNIIKALQLKLVPPTFFSVLIVLIGASLFGVKYYFDNKIEISKHNKETSLAKLKYKNESELQDKKILSDKDKYSNSENIFKAQYNVKNLNGIKNLVRAEDKKLQELTTKIEKKQRILESLTSKIEGKQKIFTELNNNEYAKKLENLTQIITILNENKKELTDVVRNLREKEAQLEQ